MSIRQRYSGTKRKLVLAFDVGTTYSGISYSILDPGIAPEIKRVTKYPAQDLVSGASKIPTVLYYDEAGTVRAAGAETLTEGVYERAEDEGWYKAEWFKMHLRPRSMDSTGDITSQLPPLPPGKTAIHVFSDFMVYLFRCAASFIQETHANGEELWKSLRNEIEFVLSHPNGWEGPQQEMMRTATMLAGLIPDTKEGYERVWFVTEGEASLHFAIQHGLPKDALKGDDGVIIVDAGGGTIDISAYGTSKSSSKVFEEIAIPQCHFNGAIFVSIYARLFLQDFLADSPFLDDLDHIVRCFDKTTKLRFSNKNTAQFIKFGSTRDNDPELGIKYGQLKMNGADVAPFFEPSISCIVKSVTEQQKSLGKIVSNIVLVGGFAASDWLHSQLTEALHPRGFTILRPDNNVNKAVADGALSFYLDRHVTVRVSKMTYGVRGGVEYDPGNSEHLQRADLAYTAINGDKHLGGVFWVLVPYNSQVSETKEFKRHHCWHFEDLDDFATATANLWYYRGDAADGSFVDSDLDGYKQMCTIEVDLGNYRPKPLPVANKPGQFYYNIEYETVVFFGGTELKAQIVWEEDGIEKRTTAKVLYTGE